MSLSTLRNIYLTENQVKDQSITKLEREFDELYPIWKELDNELDRDEYNRLKLLLDNNIQQRKELVRR